MRDKEKYAICFGEILWDIYGETKTIGGAPFNVCYHLTKNGVKSHIISQVGQDLHGQLLLDEIKKLGLDTFTCSITQDYPTSTVQIYQDQEDVRYEITHQVAWDFIRKQPEIEPLIDHAEVFIYGSLAARHAQTAETLMHYLQRAKWKIFDINLREGHYTSTTLLKLLDHCNTLKVNREELTLLYGFLSNNFDESSDKKIVNTHDAINKLFENFPLLHEILVTLGSDGAEYYSRNKKLSVSGKTIDVIDTVGCGDAFLAGYISSKLKEKSIEECLQHAVELSAFVATHMGACPSYPEN